MTFSECAALLRASDSILILTHVRPDGDTLGSAAALCHALRRLGKTACLWPNPEVTDTYAPFLVPYLEPEGALPEYGLVIAVDTADEKMLPAKSPRPVHLCLDHHPSNTGYAQQTLLWEKKASCGELVMALTKNLCGYIDGEGAKLLYIAVSTDTGCFLYGNTTGETLRAAGELIEAGADNRALNKLLFRTFSRARLTLEGLIYSTLRSYRGDAVNIAVITLDMMEQAGATENDCEDLASLPGRVAGSRVAITVRELSPGHSKASVRTGPEVNASDVCARLGGGGHAMAAGCEVSIGPLELAERLLDIVNELWP